MAKPEEINLVELEKRTFVVVVVVMLCFFMFPPSVTRRVLLPFNITTIMKLLCSWWFEGVCRMWVWWDGV